MILTFPGLPFTKQSVRSYIRGGHVHHYQTRTVKVKERKTKLIAKSQLDPDFTMWKCNLKVNSLTYIFPILKSFTKAKKNRIANGKVVYKGKRPDLTDNLNKGLFDALNGVIYKDDAQIVLMNDVKKIFGDEPRTVLDISPMK